MRVFTIGFTKSSAADFFGRLQISGVRRILDVRLSSVSQLAGFAKRDDLRYFLDVICGIDYSLQPSLAPTKPMLDAYRRDGDWRDYESRFVRLMAEREIEKTLHPCLLEAGCLLCSEKSPARCHRRLVVDYLASKWGGIEVTHL